MPLLFSITKRDLVRQTYRGSGKGGQNRNKVETAVRFIHPPSGAVAQAEEHRTQHQNERAAFERLGKHPKLQQWIRIEAARRMGAPIPETEEQIRKRVDAMVDADLKNGLIKEENF